NSFILKDWSVFFELLIEFGFFFDLGIKDTKYQSYAADYLTDFCRDNSSKIKIADLTIDNLRALLNNLDENIGRIYAGQKSEGANMVKENIQKVQSAINENSSTERVINTWNKTIKFFKADGSKKTPSKIIHEVLSS